MCPVEESSSTDSHARCHLAKEWVGFRSEAPESMKINTRRIWGCIMFDSFFFFLAVVCVCTLRFDSNNSSSRRKYCHPNTKWRKRKSVQYCWEGENGLQIDWKFVLTASRTETSKVVGWSCVFRSFLSPSSSAADFGDRIPVNLEDSKNKELSSQQTFPPSPETLSSDIQNSYCP
jgi:hypothetical protein